MTCLTTNLKVEGQAVTETYQADKVKLGVLDAIKIIEMEHNRNENSKL